MKKPFRILHGLLNQKKKKEKEKKKKKKKGKKKKKKEKRKNRTLKKRNSWNKIGLSTRVVLIRNNVDIQSCNLLLCQHGRSPRSASVLRDKRKSLSRQKQIHLIWRMYLFRFLGSLNYEVFNIFNYINSFLLRFDKYVGVN